MRRPFFCILVDDGAFRLAVASGKPVVPTLVFNTKKVLPVHKTFYMHPHPLEMHFLPPLSIDGKTVEELKEEAFEKMKNYYVSHLGN